MTRHAAQRLAPFLLLVGACALLPAACEGGGGRAGGPNPGNWLGDHIYFAFDGDRVADVRPLGVSCRGTLDGLPCTASFAGLLAGALPVADDGAFSGVLGEITLVGHFASATEASGTLVYHPADGCCRAEVAWTATWRAPTYADAMAPDGGGLDLAGPDDDLTPAQATAIRVTNEWRARVGAPPLASSAAHHRAAQAHADYFVQNCDLLGEAGLSPHAESPAHPGFTGETFVQRLRAQGWAGQGGWEVMAFQADPTAAIEAWLDTLYHRIPLVHPSAAEAGYGRAVGSGAGCGGAQVDVMDLGRGRAVATAPVRFPPDGATDVASSWHGLESPQPPLPDGESYPSGPIVTLTFGDGPDPTVTAHRLEGPDGEDVPHVLRAPADDVYLDATVALYAHDPLRPGTTYTVTIEGRRGTVDYAETWSFTTRP